MRQEDAHNGLNLKNYIRLEWDICPKVNYGTKFMQGDNDIWVAIYRGIKRFKFSELVFWLVRGKYITVTQKFEV